MAQSEGVAGFVRGGVGDRLGPGQVSGEYIDGIDHLIGEGVSEGNAASAAVPVAVSADGDAQPLLVSEAGGLDGGDVDVERRVVLGHAFPDFANGLDLVSGERCRVAILIEDRRHYVVPASLAHHAIGITPEDLGVAVEVEIELCRGRGPAVERWNTGGGSAPHRAYRLPFQRRSAGFLSPGPDGFTGYGWRSIAALMRLLVDNCRRRDIIHEGVVFHQ